jgi:hypothetical protein
VPCDVEQVSIGLWRLTPQEPLQGREYVLWKTYGATPGTYLPYVFDFRVEHDSMWTEP